MAQILHQNTLVLQSEIEALLRFNAAAFEALQLQRRETELIGLLEDLVESQRLQWQARQLRVEVSGERTTLQLDAENRLGRGQPAVQRHSLFARTGYGTLGRFARVGAVLIDVSDQGPGVAPADKAHVRALLPW